MISALGSFCGNNLEGKTVTEKWNTGIIKKSFDVNPNEVVSVDFLSFVEAKAGCE